MPVSDHKHLVQDGSVVDEALQHAGGPDVGQAAGAEDQGHLHGHRSHGPSPEERHKPQPDLWTHLVGQRAVSHSGLTNWGQRRKQVSDSEMTSVKPSRLKMLSDFDTYGEC